MSKKLVLSAVAALLVTAAVPAGAAHAGEPATPSGDSSAAVGGTSTREAPGWAGVEVTQDKVTSRVGDRDNFGWGIGFGPPPCAFWDRRAEEDIDVFDFEAKDWSDWYASWTHEFPVSGTPTKVKLIVYEVFSDPGPRKRAKIFLDDVVRDFEKDRYLACPDHEEGGLRRVFTLRGADAAAVAADGEVDVLFRENHDDIALDRAALVVTFE